MEVIGTRDRGGGGNGPLLRESLERDFRSLRKQWQGVDVRLMPCVLPAGAAVHRSAGGSGEVCGTLQGAARKRVLR